MNYTDAESCEKLCLSRNTRGCCYLKDGLGCFWVPSAFAVDSGGSRSGLAVTCSAGAPISATVQSPIAAPATSPSTPTNTTGTEYICNKKLCDWANYHADEDWGYYSKSDDECSMCKEHCTDDENCGAVECGDGYCSWWKSGVCTEGDDKDYPNFNGLICRKGNSGKASYFVISTSNGCTHQNGVIPFHCTKSDMEAKECEQQCTDDASCNNQGTCNSGTCACTLNSGYSGNDCKSK